MQPDSGRSSRRFRREARNPDVENALTRMGFVGYRKPTGQSVGTQE